MQPEQVDQAFKTSVALAKLHTELQQAFNTLGQLQESWPEYLDEHLSGVFGEGKATKEHLRVLQGQVALIKLEASKLGVDVSGICLDQSRVERG